VLDDDAGIERDELHDEDVDTTPITREEVVEGNISLGNLASVLDIGVSLIEAGVKCHKMVQEEVDIGDNVPINTTWPVGDHHGKAEECDTIEH